MVASPIQSKERTVAFASGAAAIHRSVAAKNSEANWLDFFRSPCTSRRVSADTEENGIPNFVMTSFDTENSEFSAEDFFMSSIRLDSVADGSRGVVAAAQSESDVFIIQQPEEHAKGNCDIICIQWNLFENTHRVWPISVPSDPSPAKHLLSNPGSSSCIAFAGKLFFYGGNMGNLPSNPNISGVVDVWDPSEAEGCWQRVSFDSASQAAPQDRVGHAVFVFDNRMFIFGGEAACESVFRPVLLNDIWAFDLNDFTWECIYPGSLDDLPLGRKLAVMAIWEENIFVYGGSINGKGRVQTTPTSQLWDFSLKNKTWVQHDCTGNELPGKRQRHVGLVVGDDWVIHGGVDESGFEVLDTFVFNSKHGGWKVLQVDPIDDYILPSSCISLLGVFPSKALTLPPSSFCCDVRPRASSASSSVSTRDSASTHHSLFPDSLPTAEIAETPSQILLIGTKANDLFSVGYTTPFVEKNHLDSGARNLLEITENLQREVENLREEVASLKAVRSVFGRAMMSRQPM